MDKDIALAIINGPGSTWGWMLFTIIAGLVIVYIVRYVCYDVGIMEGRAIERKEGMDRIQAQLAKISFDQQQTLQKTGQPITKSHIGTTESFDTGYGPEN